MSQLERLAKPFPSRLIHDNPSGGGSYVKHSVVTEKLLAVLGPFSFELVEVIRGHVEGVDPNPNGKSARAKKGSPALDNAIVGAVCRLSVTIDGRPVHIEEVGDCESPHNWPHDGARLKDALSDSLKRAAMRVGVTLHLWSGSEFTLYDQIKSAGAGVGTARVDSQPPAPAPQNAEVSGAGKSPKGVLESRPSTTPAKSSDASGAPHPKGASDSAAVPPSSLAREGGTVADTPFSPGQSSLDDAHSRAASIQAAGVDVRAARLAADLPPLAHVATEEQWLTWLNLLEALGFEADALTAKAST